ncbi:MAG: FKBP-type peptidyl-prolyl cis-trans isomerase [Betaproteobacteria bacterium]
MRFTITTFALLCCVCATVPAAAQSRALQSATAVPDVPTGKRTLVIERRVGKGNEAEPEQFVVIDYEGFVFDPAAPDHKGKKFDSSRDRGVPLSVLLGVGRMVEGLDKGIQGMKVGGARTLVIPPNMGFGSTRTAFGEVPPNSFLLFEVELLDVVPQQNVR